jgi:hypothetical protein
VVVLRLERSLVGHNHHLLKRWLRRLIASSHKDRDQDQSRWSRVTSIRYLEMKPKAALRRLHQDLQASQCTLIQ